MIYKMIKIAINDKKKGGDFFRIFKKSWARFRKHGFDGMYVRLENEYKSINPSYKRKANLKIKKNNKYKIWLQNEKFEITELDYYPFFSVIIPVYNTPKKFLEKSILSVLNQKYKNFEICIADDCSTNKETLKTLKRFEKKNKIKVVYRDTNGHISECLNSAVEIANGEYLVFLDHDDMLSPYALYENAKIINENPKAKLIYSDEDKIDEKDNRFSPYFKSDWNKDLFFSQNYINHLTVIKKEIADKIGGFRKGYEGSQDYDFLLRSLKYIKDEEIVHIPKILYHWRAIKGSTALDPSAKEYATIAGIMALKNFFESHNKTVEVIEGLIPHSYKVIYPVPGKSFKELIEPFQYSAINKEIYSKVSNKKIKAKKPFISIIIPTKDKIDYLKKCIDSIINKTKYYNYEIIIVSNNSTEKETFEYFDNISAENIKVIEYDIPFNYSKINNYAVFHSRGDILIFMNNDIEIISENWLCEMIQHNLRDEIGVVGAKLYYENDTIQHGGVILGIGGVAGHAHKYFSKGEDGYFGRLKLIQNYSAVTGALMSVRKEVFEEVGGFEEKLAVAFNDIDFCLKVKEKGYRNLWTPYVEAYHYESISRGKEDSAEKIERFNKEIKYMKSKWNDLLLSDKYYNPNLTLTREDFSIGE